MGDPPTLKILRSTMKGISIYVLCLVLCAKKVTMVPIPEPNPGLPGVVGSVSKVIGNAVVRGNKVVVPMAEALARGTAEAIPPGSKTAVDFAEKVTGIVAKKAATGALKSASGVWDH